jgi:hypothetical protein
MKHCTTGTGLVALSIAILGSTLIARFGTAEPAANAASSIAPARGLAAVAITQVTPTIVWYSWSADSGNGYYVLVRAWSNGRVEIKRINGSASVNSWCVAPNDPCSVGWVVVNDESQGYNAAADINFDSKVDGDDLGQLLAAWGDAPRHDIPPSDCPLNLVNP